MRGYQNLPDCQCMQICFSKKGRGGESNSMEKFDVGGLSPFDLPHLTKNNQV